MWPTSRGGRPSINLRYRRDPRYFGLMAAVKGGSLFGLNFMLRDIPQSVPFDADTSTTADNGWWRWPPAGNRQTRLLEKGKTDFDFWTPCGRRPACRWCPCRCAIGRNRYLDGGCSCPIPLHWAQQEGFAKTVIITTRQKGFRNPCPASGW